jgi:hypothetical protein
MYMKKLLLIVFPIIILTNSCINSEDYKNVKEDFKDVEYNNQWTSFDSIYSTIPDYKDISATINKLHTKFSGEYLLNPESCEKYFNSKETSVALGMYIADLGYVRHYERVQLCTEYLEAVRVLAGKLAIGEKEFNETVPVIESSLGDSDVLFSIVDSLMDAGNILLSGNEKYGISALFLAGFWVEVTYIGLKSESSGTSELNEEILKSHFEILKSINKLFACLDDDGEIKKIKSQLIEIEKNGHKNPQLLDDISVIRKQYCK